MADYIWPVSMLEGYNVPSEVVNVLDEFVRTGNLHYQNLTDLYKECELLKATSAKQDRYIAELEKQLELLQKTLNLIDAKGGR